MLRTQIQLTEQQHERLRKLAHERGISMAATIRLWVDEKLEESEGVGARAARVRNALAVCGRHTDPGGADDVADNHDRYLADAYRNSI